MRYAVQVDPDTLAAGARRLTDAAGTLDTVAARVGALCSGAAAAVAGTALALALEETGRETARAAVAGASALEDLGARTGLAGEGYRSLEQSSAGRWVVAPAVGPAVGPTQPVVGGGR